MPDCRNAEMRDALPDLMHGMLPPTRAAEVRAHLSGCDLCRAELDLLNRVRSVAHTPGIRVDRIVASLPGYRPMPAWRRVASASALRVAASIVLVAGGAAALLRQAPTAPEPVARDSIALVRPAPRELSLGETFVGVSDSALVSLVESFEDLEAVLSEEPESIPMSLLPGGDGESEGAREEES